MTFARRLGAAAVLALAASALAGCNGSTPAPTVTVTVPAPSVAATDTAAPVGNDGGGSGGGGSSGGVPACQLSQLLVSYDQKDSSAGHFHGVLHFETPAASGDCSLYGYPTVQFTATDGADGIFGPFSEVAGSSASIVVLHSAEVAHSDVTIVDPGVVDCTFGPATGFFVVPPGSPDGVFVPVDNLTGCTDTPIVTVGPVVAGP